MNHRLFKTLLQHVTALTADPADGVADAVLMQRFIETNDELAFSELVRRHGPMVWAVCRHLLPNHADAEDAFQATFLTLVRAAKSVRATDGLGGFLHGVAVKVAAKIKRGAVRRKQREQRTATPETDQPVPDAAWDELFVAVHEEVQQLPTSLRTAFVLCELQGVRQPDAAKQLGWKLGTLSGRLTKARQRLLQQLAKRGIAPAITASLLTIGATTSSATVPMRLLEAIQTFPSAATDTLPALLLELSQEVIPMAMRKLKLIALATLTASSFGAISGMWIYPEAIAQVLPGGSPEQIPGSAIPVIRTSPVVGAEGGGGEGGPAGIPFAPVLAAGLEAPAPAKTIWEYKYVPKPEMQDPFVDLLKKHGQDGWEYAGTVTNTDWEKTGIMNNKPGTTTGSGRAGGSGDESGSGIGDSGSGKLGGSGPDGFGPGPDVPGGFGAAPTKAATYVIFKRQQNPSSRPVAGMGMGSGAMGGGGMGMGGPPPGGMSGMSGPGAGSGGRGGMPGMGGMMPGGKMGGPGAVPVKKPQPTAQIIRTNAVSSGSAASLAKAILSNQSSPAQVVSIPESNGIIVIGADEELMKTIRKMISTEEDVAEMIVYAKREKLERDRLTAEQRENARKAKEVELDLQKRHEEFLRNQRIKEADKPKP